MKRYVILMESIESLRKIVKESLQDRGLHVLIADTKKDVINGVSLVDGLEDATLEGLIIGANIDGKPTIPVFSKLKELFPDNYNDWIKVRFTGALYHTKTPKYLGVTDIPYEPKEMFDVAQYIQRWR